MKFKCNKDNLINIINKTEKITSKNATLPVLSNIIISCEDNFLSAKATNLELGLDLKIKAKIEKDGEVAISGQILLAFLNSLPKNETEIEAEVIEGNLKIKTKSSDTVIKTSSNEEFPSIPEVAPIKVLKIDSKVFSEGVKSVWYASAVSSIKPELSSIYLYSEENYLCFVATDSFRLAEKRIENKKKIEFPNVLIPFKNAIEIVRVIEDLDNEIEIIFDEDQIAVKAEGLYLVSRIVDGSFPDYKQIIPKGFETKITILKEDFIQGLKTVNVFSDKFNQIKIKVLSQKEELVLSSENQDKGNIVNTLKVKIEGEDVEVSFNQKYISDCLSTTDSDSLVLELSGKSKPLVIRGLRDQSFLYLVMPMNK